MYVCVCTYTNTCARMTAVSSPATVKLLPLNLHTQFRFRWNECVACVLTAQSQTVSTVCKRIVCMAAATVSSTIIQLTGQHPHVEARAVAASFFSFSPAPTSIPFPLLVASNFKYCAAFLSGSIDSGFKMTCKNVRVIAVCFSFKELFTLWEPHGHLVASTTLYE